MAKIKKLNKIVEILTGYQVRDRNLISKQGSMALIQVKDLDRKMHKVKFDDVDYLVIDYDLSKYQIQKSDVLYLTKGNIQCFLIDEGELGQKKQYVPISQFAILRLREPLVLKEYLCWYLNSKEGMGQAKKFLKGTMMAFISREELGSLEIPIPDIHIQRNISSLMELRRQEMDLTKRIEEKKAQFYEEILSKFLKMENI